MSNNMCSLENGVTNHSMPAIVSSQSYNINNCSPIGSKPFTSHLFGSIQSSLQSSLQSLPLHSSHTAFPFPPNPLFLSSLNLFNHSSSLTSSQSWFRPHNTLNTPLSLTTNDSKDIKLSNITNDNNNNINKSDNKYKDSTQTSISTQNSLSEKSSSISDSKTTTDNTISSSISLNNLSMNESERNAMRTHSDNLNLNWLAEIAISSRGLPSSPSSTAHIVLPLSHHSSHPSHSSQRSLYHNSLPNDMTSGQRLYSPRLSPSTYFPYPTPNSPLNSMNGMNGVRPAPPPSAHFSGSFLSNYNTYQQFSPTTAQNTISSPFLVPNQTIVTNSRNGTYVTGIDSYQQNNAHNNVHNNLHNNTHNAILSATVNSCSITSQSGLTSNSSRSPSVHSSDSSSMISSGPFSSPTISSESAEPQTKSMMRSMRDSLQSPNDNNLRNDANETTHLLTGIKRKSPSSPELNNNDNNEKNLYRIPWGKEGSRKHRILKPPNISIVEPNKSVSMYFESAPLSAPPIPGIRREEFLKRISESEIVSYSNESIVDPNNCLNISFPHQRRKSVPQTLSQTSSHKPLTSITAKDNSIEDMHHLISNENSAPNEEHNHLQYPIYFRKGSIIQLGNGKVKRVEEMSTQDFIDSAIRSPDLCADCSEVVKMEEKIKSRSVLLSFNVGRTKVPVKVEAPLEHPFFVFHKGWSSCSPEMSSLRYGLKCRKLKVGDTCVSLTPKASPNCTINTISTKIRDNNEEELNPKKIKSILSNHNMKSNSTPLSLVKCSSQESNESHDCEQKERNELLVSDKVSDSVPAVPITSSIDSQIAKSVKPNRRHSAPDAIKSEPSKAS